MAEPSSDRPDPTPADPYTVHPDAGALDPVGAPARRRPDPVALVAGLVALAVAGLPLLGRDAVTVVDPRWILAATAVAVGALVLLSSWRRRR